MRYIFFLTALLSAQQLRITETAGIDRRDEPVTLQIAGAEETFFVSVDANLSVTVDSAKLRVPELKVTQAGRVGLKVENSAFLADLSPRTVDGKEEDSGTLRGLLIKSHGVLLERARNRMHWAPSFQRDGAKDYTSIAKWDPVQKFSAARGRGSLVFTREGYHALYPEIHLWAEYRFFASVPYFLFRSTMTIEKSIDMYWLRNQEMTMDDRFTHVAWPGHGGKARIATFDERKPILEKEPIPVDVPWVAFVNTAKGYGYGAVVLGYKSTTTARPVTSINDGADNGKYWDRRLVDQVRTPLKPGDRYEEHTAYVVFDCDAKDPLRAFLEWERKLRHPLRVELLAK